MYNTELNEKDFIISGEFVYIKNMKTPGLLLIHADWCGFCKKFQPTFDNLKKKMGNTFPCVSIEHSELEKSQKLSTALKFEYFPTIKFFDQTGKIINTYPENLSRDEVSLTNYICKLYHHCYQKH